LAIHPNDRWVYLINELGNTVTAFDYDSKNGTLKELQYTSTLPADFKGQSFTSEVVVHPSGKFVYGANRGHDSIAVLAIDSNSGKLTFKEATSGGGKWPRNFNIDPSGKFLLVANQNSGDVAVFSIDPATGALTSTGNSVKVKGPACVKFWPPK
jgi:6-phosphogluconolactonase